MIRRLLKWLFAKEYAEARALIENAKALPVRYVKYESYNMDTMQFLIPIQEIIKSSYFRFWLLERKAKYSEAIKYGTIEDRDLNIGRAMAIDQIFIDCVNFETKYRELLEGQAENAKV